MADVENKCNSVKLAATHLLVHLALSGLDLLLFAFHRLLEIGGSSLGLFSFLLSSPTK